MIYDPSFIVGQDNLFRYQFTLPILVLAFDGAHPRDLARIQLALRVCKAPHRISIQGAPQHTDKITLNRILGSEVEQDWAELIESGEFGHVRVLGDIPDAVYTTAAKHVRYVDATPVLFGDSELKKYALEQSVCIDYRYGHLGLREHHGNSVLGKVTRRVPS